MQSVYIRKHASRRACVPHAFTPASVRGLEILFRIFFAPPTWIGFPRGLITRATQPFSSFRSGIQAGPREEAEPLPSATVNYKLTFDLTKRSRMRTVISEDQATSTVFYRLKEAKKNNRNCKFSVARVSPRNPQIIFYIRTERVTFAENFTSTLIH